jgi:DNA (cytosine-5)-methyltransferase 1
MLTFGSLFAGVGGFDLGFERAGFECKWQVEIDDYATRVLERHWPDVHRERDIRQCGRHNLERVDCIIGGFPCVDISYAGKGAGLDGARSGLFFEAIRLVRELQPRAVVLENVAALLTRGLDRVLGTLAEVGFDAVWHCIPAAAVGAPHIRDRVFILAYSNGESALSQYTEMAELQTGDVGNANSPRRKTRAAKREVCGETRKQVFAARGENVSDTNGTQRQGGWLPGGTRTEHSDIGSGGWWAVEPPVGRVAHGIPARVDRLRCLGNAIVPQVAEVVARMAMDRLTGGEDV